MTNTTQNKKSTYDALIEKINLLTTEAGALAPKYHKLAVEVLAFHFKTGDTRPINALVNQSPKIIRKNDLGAWFIEFGALSYNLKLKEIVHDKEKMQVLNVESQLEQAEQNPFYEFRKEQEIIKKSSYDVINQLVKSIEHDLKKSEPQKWTVDDLATANAWLKKLTK